MGSRQSGTRLKNNTGYRIGWLSCRIALVTGLAWLGLTFVVAAEEIPVDLELVLAADMSGSMTRDLRGAQRTGFVSAFRDPRVQDAIRGGRYGRIAVTYVEWSGRDRHTTIVPWRLITGVGDAEAFAAELENSPVSPAGAQTAIFAMLSYASSLIQTNRYAGERLVVDISGNGPENSGDGPFRLANRRITVNGLVLPVRDQGFEDPYRDYLYTTADVVSYYWNIVAQGPGSFVIPVETAEDIARAILRKLVLEIAGLRPKRSNGWTNNAGGWSAYPCCRVLPTVRWHPSSGIPTTANSLSTKLRETAQLKTAIGRSLMVEP